RVRRRHARALPGGGDRSDGASDAVVRAARPRRRAPACGRSRRLGLRRATRHAMGTARHVPRPGRPRRRRDGGPVSTADKYARAAAGWSEQYADAEAYLRHRAELIVSLGPRLEPGDRVLDLACGDAGLAEF